MRKIVLKSVDNVVYTGEFIDESGGKITVKNVETENVQANEQIQKAKEVNIGMVFFRENIIWYTFR